jgi:hypothetical protein
VIVKNSSSVVTLDAGSAAGRLSRSSVPESLPAQPNGFAVIRSRVITISAIVANVHIRTVARALA